MTFNWDDNFAQEISIMYKQALQFEYKVYSI